MKYCFCAAPYKKIIADLDLKNLDAWRRYCLQTVLKDRTSELHRVKPPAPLPACYAKVYRYPTWNDRLRILFRGGLLGRSRAGVEFRNLRLLNRLGLSPQVIAYGRTRRWGLLSLSLLVIEEVAGAQSLDRFVSESLSALSRHERLALIEGLAAFTRTMTAGRFVNSEYHWRNILVLHTPDGFTFQLIDPSSSRWWYRLFYPLFDVATLDICAPYFFTRTERLRFFKAYMHTQGKPLTARQKKTLSRIAAMRDAAAGKELKRYRYILPNEPPAHSPL